MSKAELAKGAPDRDGVGVGVSLGGGVPGLGLEVLVAEGVAGSGEATPTVGDASLGAADGG